MEFLFRRLIERNIISKRADAGWIRRAMTRNRPDLSGTVSAVQADGVMLDRSQRWAFDIYGRFTSDGNNRAGSRLVMLDGAAAGSDWELDRALGNEMRVLDGAGQPIDLEAAGVAVGDCYEIRVDQFERAVAWFARTAIRVLIGYPQDGEVFPCYAVTLGSSSEKERPIGNHGRTIGSGVGAGPVARQLVSIWDDSIQIECYALGPDECAWMYRALEYAYRGWIMYLGRVYRERVFAQGSEPRIDMTIPQGVCVRSFTISGTLELNVEEEIPWLVDSDNPASARQLAEDVVARRLQKR